MLRNFLTTILLMLLLSDSAFAVNGREIIERAENLMKADTSLSYVLMYIHKAGKIVEKNFKMEAISIDDSERRSLISFNRPTSIRLLTFSYKNKEGYQWLGMSSGKVKRISNAAKAKSFVNSHFAYEDLSTRNIDNFQYKLLGEEYIDTLICYKIECIEKETLKNKDKRVYSKTILYARKSDSYIIKIDFYEKKELIKYMVNYNIKEIDKVLTPMRVVMYDSQNSDKTELITQKVRHNIKINSARFNREAIKFIE